MQTAAGTIVIAAVLATMATAEVSVVVSVIAVL